MTDINDTVYNIGATKKAYGLQSYFFINHHYNYYINIKILFDINI